MRRIRGSKAKVGTQGFRFVMDKGWKTYADAHDLKKFKRRLNREKKKAFDRIARDIVNEVITGSNNFAPNAPLTLLLKQGNTPLRSHGKSKGLRKSITTKTISANKVFIGFLKTSKFYPKAKIIHDGGTIRVTHKMRMMFWALWLVSKGDMPASQLSGRAAELWKLNSSWFPLNNNTKAIKIPGRPFIEDVFKNQKVINKARKEFTLAINRVMKQMARR